MEQLCSVALSGSAVLECEHRRRQPSPWSVVELGSSKPFLLPAHQHTSAAVQPACCAATAGRTDAYAAHQPCAGHRGLDHWDVLSQLGLEDAAQPAGGQHSFCGKSCLAAALLAHL